MKIQFPLVMLATLSPAMASLRGLVFRRIEMQDDDSNSPTASPTASPTVSQNFTNPEPIADDSNSVIDPTFDISPCNMSEESDGDENLESLDDILSDSLVIPFNKNIFLGAGVDAMTGKVVQQVVNNDGGERLEHFLEFRNHLSASTLRETEDTVKAIIEAEGGAYGITAGPSVEWATSRKRSTEEINLIAGTAIHSHTMNLRNSNIQGLESDFLQDLRSCKAREFETERRVCYQSFSRKWGTHYVAGIGYGGCAYSRIRVTTKSRQDKESITTGLTASFKEAQTNGEAKGKFKTTLESARTNQQATIEGDYIMAGTRVDGMGAQDLEQVMIALDKFGNEIRYGNRPPLSLYAMLKEWEQIPEVRRIMGDETILPPVDIEIINELTKSYRLLGFAYDTTVNMFDNDQWKRNIPSWSLRPQISKAKELASKILADKKKIRSLSYADLQGLDPHSPAFREEFMTAYQHELAVDDLYYGYKIGAALFPYQWTCQGIEEQVGLEFPAWQMAVGDGSSSDNILEVTCSAGKLKNVRFLVGAKYQNGGFALQMSLILRGGRLQRFDGNSITQCWASGQRTQVVYPSGEKFIGQLQCE
jgi:hypothetical protein